MKPKSKTAPATKSKRILVVDDHPLMREGVVQWIQRASDLEVCGQAESAAQALSLAQKLNPDLVLTDISLIEGIHPDTHFVFPVSNVKGDKDDDRFRGTC